MSSEERLMLRTAQKVKALGISVPAQTGVGLPSVLCDADGHGSVESYIELLITSCADYLERLGHDSMITHIALPLLPPQDKC